MEDGFLTSPRNILPNLKTYFFFRMKKVAQFPFVIAPSRGFSGVLEAMNSHGLRTYAVSESIAGVTRTSPVLWCLVAQILLGSPGFYSRRLSAGKSAVKQTVSVNQPSYSRGWVSLLFAGFGILAFFPLSLECTSSMRYILDFAPTVFLLTYMRLALLHSVSGTQVERILWGGGVSLLSGVTVLYGCFWA